MVPIRIHLKNILCMKANITWMFVSTCKANCLPVSATIVGHHIFHWNVCYNVLNNSTAKWISNVIGLCIIESMVLDIHLHIVTSKYLHFYLLCVTESESIWSTSQCHAPEVYPSPIQTRRVEATDRITTTYTCRSLPCPSTWSPRKHTSPCLTKLSASASSTN